MIRYFKLRESVSASIRSKFRSPHSSRGLSVEVKNTESTARDHLANERTFLAWARSGLGFMGAGTGLYTAYSLGYSDPAEMHAEGSRTARRIEHLHPFKVAPAAATLVANGVLMLLFATYRYFENQRALQSGRFIITKSGFMVVITTTAFSSAGALGWICWKEYELRTFRNKN